ncbi:hypothetical protein COLO4_18788 [Corchorus olitorius]|uniref:Uncharacterized protein n=1 Tax=Corchorus olitorius TaxID=93759 RepID=A0A1R3J7Z4_9ROSI|nr:hypothetical protein COLO4_18788 [Corchorus olitorius]
MGNNRTREAICPPAARNRIKIHQKMNGDRKGWFYVVAFEHSRAMPVLNNG